MYKENTTVYIPDAIEPQTAIRILKDQLLDFNYVCGDVCGEYQCNARIVKDILEKHTKHKVVMLDGKVYEEK